MDYYGLRGRGLSGVVATALDLTASKMWELLWGDGLGFWEGVWKRARLADAQKPVVLKPAKNALSFFSCRYKREDFILKKDL